MINTLTQKQLQLLNILLKQDDAITADELAKRLDTSARTVIRYVNTINDELRSYDMQIGLKRGQGYYLDGDSGELKAILGREQQLEDGTSRVNAMILAILYQETVTIERLSEMLYVSISALNKMTVAVKDFLSRYHLVLGSKPYYGLFIEGEEKDKRTVIADIGFEYYRARLVNVGIPNISPEEFSAIDSTTFSCLQRNGLVVADLDLNYLIVRMTIAFSRCRAGHSITKMPMPYAARPEAAKLGAARPDTAKMDAAGPDVTKLGSAKPDTSKPEAPSFHNYHIVREIMEELAGSFSIALPEEEYLYVLMYSGFMSYDFTAAEMKVDQEIHKFVTDFMKEMSEFTGSPYGQDENAARALSIHLKMMMQRAHSQQCFPNPVIEQIKSDYPVEMNYAIFLARRVEEHFGVRINEDEIGYLTVHLGVCQPPDRNRKKALVLCNYGVGTSQMILERMQNELTDINIVGVYPVRYLSIAMKKEVDFIISAVPVESDTGDKPLIVEENLLGARTYDHLKEAIWRTINIGNDLLGFFDPACFVRMKAADRFQVIERLSGLMKERYQMADSVLENVVQRELTSATDIGNLVAVPHMLSKGDFRSGIAVGILERPILWEKEMVQLVFLACFNQADARSAPVFRTLYKLVKSRDTVGQMIEAGSFEEFIRVLK